MIYTKSWLVIEFYRCIRFNIAWSGLIWSKVPDLLLIILKTLNERDTQNFYSNMYSNYTVHRA